jgi:hypothetical protein
MVPGVKRRTPSPGISVRILKTICLQDFRINVNPFTENGAGFFFPRFQESAPPEETVESEELVSAATQWSKVIKSLISSPNHFKRQCIACPP